jgi:hypothetical protein
MAQHESSCGQCDQLPIVNDGTNRNANRMDVYGYEWFHFFKIDLAMLKRRTSNWL